MSRLSFLAIDFETANPDQASVCQVGVAKVINGAIVESDSWLVTPPTGINSFEPRFIRIHGITPKQVRRSGTSWQASLERLLRLADGLPLVAHNVSFDRTVFRRASERVGISAPPSQWFDTLVIARRFIKAPNHRLPTVAKALNLPAFRHHQAEADAITSARIAIVLSQRHDLPSVAELWRKPAAQRRSPVPARRFVRVGDLPPPNVDAHPQHPLHGHLIVITGDLPGVNRDDFIVKIAELGAQPQLNVTKKTSMLVVANHEYFPGHYDPVLGSAKEKKAHEYRLAGQQIDFVPAQRALAMLATTVEDHDEAVSDVPDPAVEIPASEPDEEIPSTPQHEVQPHIDAKPKSKARAGISASIVRPVAWTLVGVSAILVLLVFIGATGAAFSEDPDFTIGTWFISMLVLIPIMGAPGVLGWYLLRRYPRRL